jgi:hypothetical protein
MTFPAGSKLGRYDIIGQIGAGGMGEVYRAKDPRLAREVAIKVLPAFWSQDGDRLRRFEQEARAAGALNHPAITAVYGIGQHEGAPCIVQERSTVLADLQLDPRLAPLRSAPRFAALQRRIGRNPSTLPNGRAAPPWRTRPEEASTLGIPGIPGIPGILVR